VQKYDVTGDGVDDSVTTTYTYAWLTSGSTETNQIQSQTIDEPAVTAANHGSGSSNQTITVFDSQGRAVWSKDQAGHITYNAYGVDGTVTRSIVDVNTTNTGDFAGLPSTWSNTLGLHLVTNREADVFGRTTKLTDPKGNVTYTVYDDADHEWRRYAGWTGTIATSPIEVHREYRPAAGAGGGSSQIYSEIIKSSASPSYVNIGTTLSPTYVPTAGETIDESNIVALSRSLTNHSGQVVEKDDYFSWRGGVTYSTTSAHLGSASNDSSSGNYHATLMDYEADGKLKRTESPSGTITRQVYDAFGHVLSTWVGMDDTPTTGYWSPSNTAGTNLVKVSENQYDYGGVGDGNLTMMAQYPGGGSDARVTYRAYDYRNRMVWQKVGAQADESDAVHRPITYYTYDNANHVTAVETFDGDEVVPAPANWHTPNLQNGDFESGSSGWDGSTGLIFDGSPIGISSYLGVLESHLSYTSSYTQNLEFGAGTYTIGFDTQWTDSPAEEWGLPGTVDNESYEVATIQVMLDGQPVGSPITPDTVSSHHSVDVTTLGGYHTIGFTVGNWDGDYRMSWIDNVTLSSPGGAVDADNDGVADKPDADLLRAKTTMSYDELGRVYSSAVADVDPSNGDIAGSVVTGRWYDSRGNVIKTSSPGGLVTKSVFDGAGRQTKVYQTDAADDNDTVYGDADDVSGDHVLSQTAYTYDADGNVTATVKKDRYDDASGTGELGDPSTAPKARVSYSSKYYDAANRVIVAVDAGTSGATATYTATSAGTTTTIKDSTLTGSSGDYVGKTVVVVTGTDKTERAVVSGYASHTLTLASALSSATDTTTTYIFANPERATSYKYDSAGRLGTLVSPGGQETHTSYDMMGRTTQTIADYVDGTPSASDDQTTTYTYNGQGNVLKMTAVVPGNDQETEYIYGASNAGGSDINSNDILVAIYYPNKSTGAASSSEQEYFQVNALGERKNFADRNGTTHQYTYDTLGRMTADAVSTLGSGVNDDVLRVEYSYDSAGRLATVTTYDDDSGGNVVNQVQRVYNGLGQLVQEFQAVNGEVDTGTTPSVQYAYSEMDGGNHSRLTSMTYPSGRIIDYVYSSGIDDSISRLSYIADDSSGSPGTHLEEYSYLGLSTIVKRAHPEPGVDLTYGSSSDNYAGLDGFGQVLDQRWVQDGTTDLDRYTYTYDINGNVLSKTNELSSDNSELYTYDGLNRLATFKRGTISGGTIASPTRSLNYTLDATGNWDSVGGSISQDRDHNAQNQATVVGGNSLDYDDNGNMLTDETGKVYTYDAWNRLISVKNGAGTDMNLRGYTYDGLGRKVSETPGVNSDVMVLKSTTDVSSLRNLTNVNGTLFFAGFDSAHGTELWKSDGTAAGTMRVTDINSGSVSSWPGGSGISGFGAGGSLPNRRMVAIGSTLYFVAEDSTHGEELWKSDGTSSGTVMVKDINVGSGSSSICRLTNINGTLYFAANDGTSGLELWTSDGTSSGTTIVKDIKSGSASGISGTSGTIGVYFNSKLFFAADDGTNGTELWTSDGTSTGTTMLKDIRSGSSSSSPTISGAVVIGSTLYFSADDGVKGRELWKSDGTSSGTALVKDVNTTGTNGINASSPSKLCVVGSTLYFAANDGTHGNEIWKSDGTSSGTTLVTDVHPNGSTLAFGDIINFNGTIVFGTSTSSYGRELWTLNPANDSYALLKDISPGTGSSNPMDAINDTGSTPDSNRWAIVGDVLYFVAKSGIVDQLWQTDGTVDGTTPYLRGVQVSWVTAVNGNIMYSSNDPDDGFLHTLDLSPTQLYYSDQWQVLESRRSTGAAIEQYVWSAAYVDAVVERDRNGDNDSSTGNRGKTGSGLEQRTYALQDANWNTTAVVLVHDDDWVELVDRILYDPYGAPTFLYSDWTPDTNYPASVSSWIYLPQGGRYDPATGLVDKRNRVYSTSLGRPVQTDPKGYPDGLNRYQWEGSNPISRLDPTGTWWNPMKWLYTGDGYASDEVYDAALDAGSEGANDGFFAMANGFIPFCDPFGKEYFYDACDPMLKWSEALGGIARDALLAAFLAAQWGGDTTSMGRIGKQFMVSDDEVTYAGMMQAEVMQMLRAPFVWWEGADTSFLLTELPASGDLAVVYGTEVTNCFTGAAYAMSLTADWGFLMGIADILARLETLDLLSKLAENSSSACCQ
jgi:RHS repeat-associated protein